MALIDNYERQRIARPTFAAPNTEALSALRGRAGAIQSTIDNPLAAPGVSGTLSALNTQLARQAQAARGQAMGRATSSGQAGFAGTMAQAGTNIEGALGDARYQGQAGLVANTLKSAQEEMMQNLRSRGEFEGQLNAQQLDRTKILSDVDAENARLDAEYARMQQAARDEAARRALEERRLQQAANEAEAARQARLREFDMTYGEGRREYDMSREEQMRQYNLSREEQIRQYNLNRGDRLDENASPYGASAGGGRSAGGGGGGGGRSAGGGGGGGGGGRPYAPSREDYLNERNYEREQRMAEQQRQFQLDTERNNAIYRERARQEEMQRRADKVYWEQEEERQRPRPYLGRYSSPGRPAPPPQR